MNIRAILLGTATCALLASPAFAAASSTDMRLDQLEQMVKDQNTEIQELKAEEAGEGDVTEKVDSTSAHLDALQDQMYANTAAMKSAWWANTKVSGRMYFDISDAEQKTNGADVASQKGVGFDIKRFYIGIDHKFDDVWSANITTDFTYDSTAKVTQLYIKKAYLDAHVDDALDIRLGSTDLPWVPFAEGIYGYRYVENTLIDRTKFGTSADWGVHASGKFANGMFAYAVSVVNGAGYKAPPGAGNNVKFKTVDVEGRLSATMDNFTLAVGGYDGRLGKDMQGASPAAINNATRFDALAAYTDDNIHAGVEYFSAHDFFNVAPSTTTCTAVASPPPYLAASKCKDSDSGYSAFASYHFVPEFGVFGRYDWVQEKTNDASIRKPQDGYYNVGVEWVPSKIVSLSLVYKHDSESHGALSQQNGSGTLGSSSGLKTGTFNEIGVFGLFQF